MTTTPKLPLSAGHESLIIHREGLCTIHYAYRCEAVKQPSCPAATLKSFLEWQEACSSEIEGEDSTILVDPGDLEPSLNLLGKVDATLPSVGKDVL